MKKTIFLSFAFFAHLLLSAQNYISNPSFEQVTGTLNHSFFEGEVTGWFAVGADSYVTNSFNCGVLAAQEQDYAVHLSEVHAIVNKLAKPVLPYQKLDISFWANMLNCVPKDGFMVEFYLSNTATNTASPFPLFPNPLTYLKVGEKQITEGNHVWKNYTTTLEATPWLNNIPCSYQYMVIAIKDLPNLNGGANNRNIPDYVYLDNLQLTDCLSLMTSEILYNVDNDGICSNVLFTADCSDQSELFYLWDFGDGTCEASSTMNTSHTYNQMGTYTVTLTIVNEAGCVSVTSEEINVSCQRCRGIKADFNAECVTCEPIYVNDPKTQSKIFVGYSCEYKVTDQSTPSSGSSITSWEWTKEGTSLLSTLQNPTITLSVIDNSGGPIPTTFTTTLCLDIEDANGCKDRICKPVSLPCDEGGSGSRGVGIQRELSVFPNPSSDGSVTVLLPFEHNLSANQLNVFDIQGQLIKQINLSQGQTEVTLDMGNLSNGMYLFMVKDAAGFQHSHKVVIQSNSADRP